MHRHFGPENKRESRPKTFKMLVLDKDGIVYQRKGGLYSK